jgi:two-component system C4-dicarboxylate transport sensor histidine kinase DctB
VLTTIRERFEEWTRLLPPEELCSEMASPKGWVAVFAMAIGCIAVGAWIPFSKHLFLMDAWPPLCVFSAAPLMDFLALRQLRKKRRKAFALLTVLQSTLLQLFSVILIVDSTLFGAVLFASWILVVASVHGHLYRSSLQHPFISAATILVSAIGIALSPTKEHIAVLAVIGPASALSAALVGGYAVEAERTRTEAEQLRSTIQAQLVWEHSLRADRLAGSLEQVAQWNHDMRNAMTAAVCNAQILALGGEKGSGGEDVQEAILDIQRSLEMLSAGFEDLRRISRNSAAESRKQSVEVGPLARTVVSGVRARFPNVEVELDLAPEPAVALIRGGTVSVHRILENLLINACEGDGKVFAKHVRLAMGLAQGVVHIEVRDDGPGFPQYLLEGSAPAFVSSKPRGTGLGLHGVEQLIAASEGRIVRSNPPGGGAMVMVEFPAAPSEHAHAAS